MYVILFGKSRVESSLCIVHFNFDCEIFIRSVYHSNVHITSKMSLFGILNDSIFGKQTEHEHKCNESNCKGEKLYGLKLKCSRCENEGFFDCLASRPEIKHLCSLINYKDSSDGRKQTNKAEKTLKILFAKDSVFHYLCTSCKAVAPQTQQASEVDSDSITQNEIIDELKSRVSSLEIVISDLKKQLISQLSIGERLTSAYKECMTDLARNKEEIGNVLKSLEFPGTSSTVSAGTSMSSSKPVKCKNNDLLISPTIDLSDTLSSSDPIENLLLPPPKSKQLKNMRQLTANNETKMYEIYLSKFALQQTCDAIEKYIVEKTPISNASHFNVEKIKHKSFSAFKITVLKKEINDLILDENLWSPNYSASPFDHSKVKKASDNRIVQLDVQSAVRSRTNVTAARPQRRETQLVQEPNNVNNQNRNRNRTTPATRNMRNVAYSTPVNLQPPNSSYNSISRQIHSPLQNFVPNNQQYQYQQPLQQSRNNQQYQYQQPLQQSPNNQQYPYQQPSHQSTNFWTSHNGLQQPILMARPMTTNYGYQM